jgi:hypothetical protein
MSYAPQGVKEFMMMMVMRKSRWRIKYGWGEKLKLHTFYNLVIWKKEMEMRRYHRNAAASVRFEVLAAVLLKIQVFRDVILTTDWQTEIDISKVGNAFISTFMLQKKREIRLRESEDGAASLFRNTQGLCAIPQNI